MFHAALKRETLVAILMAMCPRCKIEVNTGVSADTNTIRELGSKLQVLVLCDECRHYHKMLVKDLHLANDLL